MKHKNIESKISLDIKEAKKQIIEDQKNNELLKDALFLKDYFLFFRKGFKLIALIPVFPTTESRYSFISTSLLKETHEEVVPAHIYQNPEKSEINIDYFNQSNEEPNFFLFTSEISNLFSYEKIPHTQKYHYVKKENSQAFEKYVLEHPVIIVFMGNDDTHYGIRFKTEKDAIETLSSLNDFEDIDGFHIEFLN